MSSNFNFSLSNAEIGVMVTLNSLFSFTGTIGNVCVCLAFLLHRNVRNTLSIFIFSLACSDVIVCLIAQPMYIVKLLRCNETEGMNIVTESIRIRLTWLSLLASIGNLLGVTLDRYFVICHPLRYTVKGHKTLAHFILAVVWSVACTLGMLTETYKIAKFIGQVYVVVLLVGIIIPLYCRILMIARRHAKIIRVSFTRFEMNSDERSNSFSERTRQLVKGERSSLKTVGIIVGIFIAGWFPILVLPFFYRAGYNKAVMLRLFQWSNTLALCSSALNPLVYSWRDRRFRKALNMMYSKWRANHFNTTNKGVVTRSETPT